MTPRNDPGADITASGASSSSPADNRTPPTLLLVGGAWVRREPDWRHGVDLATAPRHLVYGAGLRDGYEAALADLRDVAELLCGHLALVDAVDRAERRVRRAS